MRRELFLLFGFCLFVFFPLVLGQNNHFGAQIVGYSVPQDAQTIDLGELRGNVEVYSLLDVNVTESFTHSIIVKEFGKKISVVHSLRPTIINVAWVPNAFKFAVTTDLVESGQFVLFPIRRGGGVIEYVKWFKGESHALVFDANNSFDANHLVFNGFIRDFQSERLNGFVPAEIRISDASVKLFFTTPLVSASNDINIGDTILETTFAGGTHQQTETGADGNVSLATVSGSTIFSDGNYTSIVFDAGAAVNWLDFNWSEGQPYKFAYPDNNALTADINAQGTNWLFHFNGNANDTTTGLIGTLLGNTTCGFGGKFGQSCYLDGSNDAIQIPNAIPNSDSSTFTAMGWFMRTRQTSAAGRQALVHGSETGSTTEVLRVEITDTNAIRYDDDFAGAILPAVGLCVSDLNTWNHFAVTRTDAAVNLYMNGKLCGTDAALTANTGTFGAQNIIGGRPDANTSNLQGFVDDYVLLNKVLTLEEIRNVYRRGVVDVNLQVRSCNDANCAGESFVGGDGTNGSHFVDGNANYDLNVVTSPNQFFQFIAFFATQDINIAFDPYLLDVSIDYEAVAGGDTCTNNGANLDWVVNDACHFKSVTLNLGSGSLFVGRSGLIGLDAAVVLARALNLVWDSSEVRQQFAQGGQVLLKHG